MKTHDPSPLARPPSPWQRSSAALWRGFQAYSGWLVRMGWLRLLLLSLALLIGLSVLDHMPPLNWRIAERTVDAGWRGDAVWGPGSVRIARPWSRYEFTVDERGVRLFPRGPGRPADAASGPVAPEGSQAVQPSITIDERGVRIQSSGADAPSSPSSGGALPSVTIDLPRGSPAAAEVRAAIDGAVADLNAARQRTLAVTVGDVLFNLATFFILASVVLKLSAGGRVRAESRAAEATAAAEAESLKRQLAEARMATMQAQVEPHFLFNTLASIEHLIETDPPRAARMQQNLIAMLRASMPTMREATASALHDLGRELDVVRPYLELLRMRMEERLRVAIDVPEGLLSAAFPPMMVQGLVENAIKHGLEPKPEGGALQVRAEIVHGALALTVADTGLGFGRAPTGGSGVGLANIRERLALLYGAKAALTIAENQPTGTRVTITVPYVASEAANGTRRGGAQAQEVSP